MNRHRLLVLIGLIAACTTAGADGEGADAPTTRPAEGATADDAPAAPAEVAPEVRAILDGMERAGEEHTSIRGEIFYRVVNRTMGDTEVRTGWVAYCKGTPEDTPEDGEAEGEAAEEESGDEAGPEPAPRFRIHFDTLKLDDGKPFEEVLDYAFDGRTLTVVKHRIKQMTRYRLGEEARRPMKLGEGPFPLPFGQRAKDMLEHFEITTRPPADEDEDWPDGREPGVLDLAEYLKLVPREAGEDDRGVREVEMWLDPETYLPIKIITQDAQRNVTTLVFRDVDPDTELDEELFRLPKPRGYKVDSQNLAEAEQIVP